MAKKDDLKAMKKKNYRLKGELTVALDDIQKLKSQIEKMHNQNFSLCLQLDKETQEKQLLFSKIDLLKKELAEATAPVNSSGKKIGKWNVVKSGAYYRAFRRIDGELKCIYLGKDLRGAAQKIKAKEKFL
jgi:hypothetical protein